MKKLIAAILAILCLAGCGNAKNQVESATTTVTKTEAPVVEAPAEEPVPEEVPLVEVPMEQTPAEEPEPLPEEPAEGQGSTVAVPVELLEGLVGDAVGYSYQKTVFTDYPGSAAINDFYAELAEGLVDYANGAVNEYCLSNNCVASVYGTVRNTALTGDVLEIVYECRVEYSGGAEPAVNTRTDVWNIQTGEKVN